MDDTPDRTERPADEAPPDSGSSAENACPRCEGSGQLDGETCGACGGTGRVEEAVGGG
jgi:DnaJ-class molecular chaperone